MRTLEKQIYNFLDRTLGHEVNCITTTTLNRESYIIMSTKGHRILEFVLLNGDRGESRVALFRSKRLTSMVSSFFGIDDETSTKYIKYWFGDTHGLKKVGDVVKFIPQKFDLSIMK